MAKCVSHLHSSMRGSIAGVTYLTTPSGQIIARQRTKPVNPSTDYQSGIRTSFSDGSAQWRGLTQLQRDAWVAWSVNFPGNCRNLFMGAYALAQYLYSFFGADIPMTLTAPEFTGTPALIVSVTDYDGGPGGYGISLNLNNPSPVDMFCLAQISPLQDASRMRYKGPWNSKENQSAKITANTEVQLSFDGLTTGRRYFFRVKPITGSETTGFRGLVPGTESMVSGFPSAGSLLAATGSDAAKPNLKKAPELKVVNPRTS